MKALADYIRVYDDALAPDFCAQLVAGFEQMADSQRRNGRGIRPGLDNSAWTEMNIGAFADKAFLGFFLMQIERYLERSRLGETVVDIGAIQKTITNYERAKGKPGEWSLGGRWDERRGTPAALPARALCDDVT